MSQFTPERNPTGNLYPDTPPVPPKKRSRRDIPETHPDDELLNRFCPQNMRLVSVLNCDSQHKRVVLHTRLNEAPNNDAIVVLEKTPFPKESNEIISYRIVHAQAESEPSGSEDGQLSKASTLGKGPNWQGRLLLSNDCYHRFYVTAGFELANGVDMTVIYPAKDEHFKRYSPSCRRLFEESPETYHSLIVPFLAQQPRDLSWVENILSGEAEADRIIFSDSDPSEGFTLVMDYRWNGIQLVELHCLGIAKRNDLTCLRDLRASHLPLLRRILSEGRKRLCAKFASTLDESGDKEQKLDENQIMAYVHYPPTFYHLHVHFIHMDSGDSASVRIGRAHLLEDVVRNLELDSNYYAERVMTVCMYEGSPMFKAVQGKEKE